MSIFPSHTVINKTNSQKKTFCSDKWEQHWVHHCIFSYCTHSLVFAYSYTPLNDSLCFASYIVKYKYPWTVTDCRNIVTSGIFASFGIWYRPSWGRLEPSISEESRHLPRLQVFIWFMLVLCGRTQKCRKNFRNSGFPN